MNKESVDGDRQLLKQIADGDRHALTDLYSHFQRPLFSYLLQLILNPKTLRFHS